MAPTVKGEPVGVVGLGNMGGAIGRSALRGGFDLHAYDVRAESIDTLVRDGATAAPSLAVLAASVQVLLVVVVTDDQVKEVGACVLANARPGTRVVVHSTVRPTTVIDLAEAGADNGISVIDAGVGGGAELAEQGKLTLFIGGSDADVAYCEPLFAAIGERFFHVGPPGAGIAAKLVNNLLSIGGYALQLEAMQLGAAYGLDEDTVTTFLTPRSSGNSRGIRTWGRHDRARRSRRKLGTDWSERMGKDLFEAALAAGLRDVTLPLTAVAAQLLPYKLRERDALLDGRPTAPPVPRCRVCDYELAAPFRAAGVHPECQEPDSTSGKQ